MKRSELLFLLAGLSLGALAGILFAPDKGEVTRERISKKAGDLKHEFEEKSAELRKELAKKTSELKAELKKDLEEQIELSKSKIQKFTESVTAPIKEKLKDKNANTEAKEA
ncbi:MAG: hypothetical protein OHK0057_08740 [Thermoflexibacter sp.]